MMISKLFRKDHGAQNPDAPVPPSSASQDVQVVGAAKRPAKDRVMNITSVTVPKYRARGSFVEYVIECTSGHVSWQVFRRYQQFKALDHQLKQLSNTSSPNHCEHGVVPVLTGSHWTEVTNQSPELVERRRRFLEVYLQQLVVPSNQFYTAKTALYNFLHDGEVETHNKGKGSRPLPGFSTFDVPPQSSSSQSKPSGPVDEAAVVMAAVDELQTDNDELRATRDATEAAAVAAAKQQYRQIVSTIPTEALQSPESPVSTAIPSYAQKPFTTPAPQHVDPKIGITEEEVREAAAESPPISPPLGMTRSSQNHIEHAKYHVQCNTCGCVEDIYETNDMASQGSLASERRCPVCSTVSSFSVVTQALSLDTRTFSAADEDVPSGDDPDLDERLPAQVPYCLQCNAEYSSILFPHRCYLCKNRYCRNCLKSRNLGEDVVANVCHQCSENFDRHTAAKKNSSCPSPGATGVPHSQRDSAPTTCAPSCPVHADETAEKGVRGSTGIETTTPAAGTSSRASGDHTHGSPAPAPSHPQCKEGGNAPECTAGTAAAPSISSTSSTAALTVTRTGTNATRTSLRSDVSLDDFLLVTTLGRGTFGKVMKVVWKGDGNVYAMKVLNKCVIHKRRMIDYIKEEKSILSFLPVHPFVVTCHFAFQTDYYVYFVMDYLPGGELYSHIYPKLTLKSADVRLYIAEIVLGLEHLHKYDVVHRDVKPENIVLDADGHANLTDFGLARKNFSRSRRRSFVGSAEYLAPETIQGEYQTQALDWWSVGVLLYEMLFGVPPFHAGNNNEVYRNVLQKTLDFSAPCFTPESANLIQKLLIRNPKQRLSNPEEIKAHPYFAGLDWDALMALKIPPPFVPNLRDNDTKYFKREFTAEWATIPSPGGVGRKTLDMLTRRFSNFIVAHKDSNLPPTFGAGFGESPSPLTDNILNSSGGALVPTPGSHGSGSSAEPQQIDPTRFAGVWRLVKVEMTTADGKVSYPWGSEVCGLLVYHSNGLYAIQVCPMRRHAFKSPIMERSTREELSEVYCTYVSSFGTYVVKPGKNYLIHVPTGDLCPNLVNKPVKRYFELLREGSLLNIASVPIRSDGGLFAQTAMTWERVANPM